MRENGPAPINDEHVGFAKKLVALARENGVDDLTVQFRLTGGRRFFEGGYNPTRVSFHWHSGRHGEASSFLLRAEAEIRIEEQGDPE